jgi:aminopeptidase YwaD
VLFLAFSGEESGLNGSRFYTRNPIRPIDQHAIMLNFDMIGRIQDGGLSLSGTGSAKGMMEWLQPIVDKSPLNIKPSAGVMAASDHYPFYQARVPVLFAIVSPLHADYHTPRDTADKINRVDAVHAMRLFRDIAAKVATIEEPIEYSQTARGNRPRQAGSGDQRPRMRLNVRFGIMPGSYESDAKGVLVGDVTSGGSAEKGGIEAGDRMVKWNGKAINDVRDWMTKLMQHKPGDKVKVTVLRDGKQKELTVELQGR